MRTIGNHRPLRLPALPRPQHLRLDGRRAQSFAVLDAYAAAGGNFIDTADSYSAWVDGNTRRRVRDDHRPLDVGARQPRRHRRRDQGRQDARPRGPGARDDPPRRRGLARAARTDRIDLYYAHMDDEDTPLEETLAAFGELIARGQGAPHRRLQLHARRGWPRRSRLARANGLPAYVALQPGYNLMDRSEYEGALAELCEREGVACVPYYGARQGLPDRQVPPRRPRGRARSAPARRAPTSTIAASRSWRRSTRSRRPTARRSPRSRSPGWPRSRRSSRRSPAPARRRSSPSSSASPSSSSPRPSCIAWRPRPPSEAPPAPRSARRAREPAPPCADACDGARISRS